MIKLLYRDHRSTLAESMKTIREIKSNKDIEDHLFSIHYEGKVDHKYLGFDDISGWDTYIITLNGDAVGFTNGPTPGLPELPHYKYIRDDGRDQE